MAVCSCYKSCILFCVEMFGCKLFNSDMGSVPLTERQTSPSELGPENLDLSSFNGSYRMWRRLVHFMLYIFGLWPSVL